MLTPIGIKLKQADGRGFLEGTNGAAHVYASPVSYYWSGAGTTNAPTATDIADFTLGVNSDGASTGNVYWVIGGSWVDTGATVTNLFGG